jgi:hypothetical protein
MIERSKSEAEQLICRSCGRAIYVFRERQELAHDAPECKFFLETLLAEGHFKRVPGRLLDKEDG